jgi:hypothetical protein
MSGIGAIKEEVVFVFPSRVLSMFFDETAVGKISSRGACVYGV